MTYLLEIHADEFERDLHTLRDRVLLDWSKGSVLDFIDGMLRKAQPSEPSLIDEVEALVTDYLKTENSRAA